MLRLRIDRSRLLLLPLFVASLLLLAFALAVGAQSGPSLTIRSDPPEEVSPGANITFTISYLLPATITQALPGTIKATWSDNASFVSASGGAAPANIDRELRWEYQNIQLFSTQFSTFTLKAGDSPGAIVVTATLTVSATSTPFTDTVSVPIVQFRDGEIASASDEADLSQSSLVISPTITAGLPITMTVLISNTGSAPAEAIRFALSDTLTLDNLAIAGRSQTVAALLDSNGLGFRLLESLAPQQEAEVLLTARVAPDAVGALRIAGLLSTDRVTQSISAMVSVNAPALPRLMLALDGPETMTAGEVLQLLLKVTNSGTVAVESVEVAIGVSPSMDLVALGPSVVSAAQEGTQLLIKLASVAPGETSEVSLTGVAPSSPLPLTVDASVSGEGYESASRLVDSQTIILSPPPIAEPAVTLTVVTPTVAAPTPTLTPPQPPDGGMDTLLTIGIVALLVAVGSAIALLLLLRRNRKQKLTPVPPAVQPGTGQSGPAVIPPAPPTPVRSAPGAFLDSLSPVVNWALGDGIITIGRAPDSTICIDERYMNWETVSRKHAEIRREGDYYVIRDLSNRNGVYVEGQRTAKNLLRSGWRVGIGGVEFIFRDAAPDQ